MHFMPVLITGTNKTHCACLLSQFVGGIDKSVLACEEHLLNSFCCRSLVQEHMYMSTCLHPHARAHKHTHTHSFSLSPLLAEGFEEGEFYEVI